MDRPPLYTKFNLPYISVWLHTDKMFWFATTLPSIIGCKLLVVLHYHIWNIAYSQSSQADRNLSNRFQNSFSFLHHPSLSPSPFLFLFYLSILATMESISTRKPESNAMSEFNRALREHFVEAIETNEICVPLNIGRLREN